jgi:cytochrome c6
MSDRGAHRMPRTSVPAGVRMARRGALRTAWPSVAILIGTLLLASSPARASDPLRGAELFRTHCASCHGHDGRPVLPVAPDLSRPTALLKPDLTLLASIRSGRGAMPAYQGLLRDREILDIVAHLRTLR